MKKEYYLAALIGILVIFLVNLPFLFGVIYQRSELVYLGKRDINSQDTYTYVSFIEQSKQGAILLENLYMSEEQKPSLLRPSYLVIGKIANVFNLSSILTFHLSRVMLIAIFLPILYYFISIFLRDKLSRLLAFSLILTSSGLGYLLGNLFPDSSDLWIPESITFLALGEAPHFILSLILMLSGFILFLKGIEKAKIIFYVLSSIFFLLLSFEHPFNLFVVGLTVFITIFWLFKKKGLSLNAAFTSLGIILPVLALGLFYQYSETRLNPVMESWAAQNSLLSPEPISFLFGFGLIIPLALIGIERSNWSSKNIILLLSWVGATFSLLYLPFFFQRRFIEGVHLPLSIFAAIGLISLGDYAGKFFKFSAQRNSFVIIGFLGVFVLMLSSLSVTIAQISAISKDNPNAYYYHLLPQEIEGMNWIKQYSSKQDVILTNWFYGNLLPGLTGRKVFLGHKVQTPYFDEKIDRINFFLKDEDPETGQAFLKENQIAYIYLGRNDTILTYGFKPDEKLYLEKVFDNKGAVVYKVK